MRKQNTVLILGILAIVFMIIAQVIILRGLWKQQNEMLTLRYRSLSQEARMSQRGSFQGYDTVMYLLNIYSASIVSELSQIKDNQELDQKKKDILEYFTIVLNTEQDFSDYLSSYFENQGFEKDFNHRISISNLEIINSDTTVVYRNEAYAAFMSRGFQDSEIPAEESRSSILVYRYRLYGDYFYLNFDYYIDFSSKQKMILREISAFVGMSLISILVVSLIFFLTYRNLMEERRLSNLKTDFINNMTHELKTPLATITVAGKTLEMEKIRKDDSKIMETAKLIGKQSVHLNQLINMILEISMWERTQFELYKKKVDIEEVIKDIVMSFKTGAGNSMQLTEKYNFNGIQADIDLIYFTTMINNLLSNAVKYCDREPDIQVEGSVENNYLTIKIADNGIGISRNDQKHVFDKFYRATSGNIHKYKGLGLGLYYVKKIATAHGGDVTLSSKPGKGSIFTVTIPY